MTSPQTLRPEMEDGNIRVLIDEIRRPVFVVNTRDNTIVCANKVAIDACGGGNLAGWPLDTFTTALNDPGLTDMVYFGNQWLIRRSEHFSWGEHNYIKIILHNDPAIPSEDGLECISEHSGLLMHRFHSPLTGIQGFTSLMAQSIDRNDERSRRYLFSIQNGIVHLIDMLKELDLMQTLERNTEIIYSNETVQVDKMVTSFIQMQLPEIADRIQFRSHAEEDSMLSNASKINYLMSLLLANAAEHTSGLDKPIIIEAIDTRSVRITNFGTPIPENISAKLYHPFVTSKSQSLGIGLTLAHLVARQIGATVILRQNDAELGITFEILFPPQLS
jgi:signal transduction histidine kinase